MKLRGALGTHAHDWRHWHGNIYDCRTCEVVEQRSAATPDAYITTHNLLNSPVVAKSVTLCECGSEAIGGLNHSTWCPKHD